MKLFTIGHSNHSADKFIQLLDGHSVNMLVDVRSTPYSRFNPQFNMNSLQKHLHLKGIWYVYAGDKLGGRTKDPTCYIHHAIPPRSADFIAEILYAEVMKRPWFFEGITELLDLTNHQTTCIMCSEKDPAMCHRHHLIASYLVANHPEVAVLHILPDGDLIEASAIGFQKGQSDNQQISF
jgi:uncharacterized protein (DUF488 family)